MLSSYITVSFLLMGEYFARDIISHEKTAFLLCQGVLLEILQRQLQTKWQMESPHLVAASFMSKQDIQRLWVMASGSSGCD